MPKDANMTLLLCLRHSSMHAMVQTMMSTCSHGDCFSHGWQSTGANLLIRSAQKEQSSVPCAAAVGDVPHHRLALPMHFKRTLHP